MTNVVELSTNLSKSEIVPLSSCKKTLCSRL